MAYKLEDGVTQSMLMSYLGCRQRFRYMAEGWEPEQTGLGDAMLQGSCFHHLLEFHYENGLRPEDADEELRGYIATAFPRLIDPEPVVAMCCTLFPHYLRYHKADDAKVKWKALEKEFDVEWNGYRLRGKIDGIFLKGKDTWTFETKTTSQFPDGVQTAYSLSFSFQNFFYATALSTMGYDITGTTQNYIRTPMLKFKTADELAGKLEKSIADNGLDYYFRRYPIVHSQRQKARFWTDLISLLREFEHFLLGDIRYPGYRNHAGCINRGTCPYLAFCATGQPAGYSQTKVFFRELEDKA